MARTVTPLTDTKCDAAKPRDKDYKLFDGQGLFLLVKASGVKTWRLKYRRPDGREGLAIRHDVFYVSRDSVRISVGAKKLATSIPSFTRSLGGRLDTS